MREYHSNDDGCDEKTKIIQTAVKLIQNDIARVNLDSSIYPSIFSMTDIDSQLAMLPESLKLLSNLSLRLKNELLRGGRT